MRKFAMSSCFLAVLFLCGCSKKMEEPHRRDVFAMDTYMSLTAYGSNSETALDLAEHEINRIESLMSVTKSDSDVGRINSSNGGSVEMSPDTAEVISTALEFCDFTSGALDITIYPVLKEWGFTTDNYSIPSMGILNQLLENVNYSNVKISGNTVTLPQNYEIDLGALAKGYASDRVVEVLRENGVDAAIVSLGGNVKTLGKKANGEQWSIAVRSPFDDTQLGYIEIDENAVVTSGGYERNFTGSDGKIYHHIIDPNTGYPSESGLASVTIISDSGIVCDALSTALFILGKEKAIELWNERNDFEMILVTDDKQIAYTEGIEADFYISSNMKRLVIRRD